MEVLGNVNLTCTEVFELVKRIYPLSNIGDRFDFIGHDKTGRVIISEKLVNRDVHNGMEIEGEHIHQKNFERFLLYKTSILYCPYDLRTY